MAYDAVSRLLQLNALGMFMFTFMRRFIDHKPLANALWVI